MANDVKFEGKERRLAKIESALPSTVSPAWRRQEIFACPRALM